MMKYLRVAALALVAFALFALPARATDLPVDGNLRFSCGTATAAASAATLNNKCGVVTTESLTTLTGSEYTLTLTNSTVASTDILLASVSYGTSTTGAPVVSRVISGTGSAGIVIRLMSTAILNGTLQIKFLNFKQ